MTGKPSQMETAIERRPSLADAVPAQVPMSGTTRTRLRNSRTGEWFNSFCSAHWDYDPECSRCHDGVWGY